MKNKNYSYFYLEDGATIALWTNHYSCSNVQHARLVGFDIVGKASFINRPWESFDYENAILNLAAKLEETGYKAIAASIRKACEKRTKQDRQEAEEFVKKVSSLSDGAKGMLKNHLPEDGIQTEGQANAALAFGMLYDAMNGTKK